VYTVPGFVKFRAGIEASDLVFSAHSRPATSFIEINRTDDRLTISDQANYASISEFCARRRDDDLGAAATAAATDGSRTMTAAMTRSSAHSPTRRWTAAPQ